MSWNPPWTNQMPEEAPKAGPRRLDSTHPLRTGFPVRGVGADPPAAPWEARVTAKDKRLRQEEEVRQLASAQAAAAEAPDDPAARRALGVALGRQGMFEEALP